MPGAPALFAVALLLSLLSPAAAAAAPVVPHGLAPGWNGRAKTPPLGWRSWNAFGNRIDQAMMIK